MEILYADQEIAVFVKPVGLDSEKDVPAKLTELLGGEVFPLHRLDQNVGGVMVCARTKTAAARLSKEISENRMIKEYVALVHGTPPEQGDWKDLLFKDSRKNKVYVVNRMRNGVKEAHLEYRRLCAGQQSLVLVRLHTGRSHQIRAQFSSRGYPLVGDHKYGSRAVETAPMLFSCRLTFFHQGREQVFTALPAWAADAKLN